MKRILIIKLWALGDILMATPLLTNLHMRYPDIKIVWLADTFYAGLLEDHPLIDQVIAFDSGRWRRLLRKGKLFPWLAEARSMNKQMREQHFDAVINCHPEKWWTRLFCSAPMRVGLFPTAKLPWTHRLYTRSCPKLPPIHNSDHFLEGLEALGISGPFDRRMSLSVSGNDQRQAHEFLRDQREFRPDLPLIVLHPGASRPSKCWLPESFASVATQLSERWNVVITGSADERKLAEAICAGLPKSVRPPVIAAGQLDSVGATAALIQKAAAVVTGDTASLHIASALSTPMVAIYGSTRPGDNAPLFGPSRLLFDDTVPCAPCYKSHCPLKGRHYLRCQRAVTPERILEALDMLLKETHESHSPQ